jgi:twitching motility protein PilT
MARLDAVIERLFKESGAEIVMETGTGISIRTSVGAIVPVLKQTLTTPQIIGALAEIVPADVRGNFPSEGTTQFPYLAPSGAVQVKLVKSQSKVSASVAPYGGARAGGGSHASSLDATLDEEPMELASPADMMDLAAMHSGGSHVRAKESQPAPAKPKPVRATTAASATGPSAELMRKLLADMLQKRASDLHLSSQTPPMFRIDGDMVSQDEYGVVAPQKLKEMLWSIAPEKNIEQWEELHDTDFAHETDDARFRVNVFADRKGIGAVLRQIPTTIRSAEEMGLSKHILDLCTLNKGLVLVTGPTGSGKSTTLAAMIDFINRNREDHIITIEDPIEFVHPNKKCLVNQREIGVHTTSFKHALRAALREDPDIVLVGELRDLETIAIAIETAETGHLVFGTLHTNTAPSTVDRIIDQFPPDRQAQIRTMLSESLKGVISQTLCKKVGGGRAAAQEVLLCTGSVANLIREGKTFQIPSIMQTAKGQGMVTLNDALFDLVKRKVVEPKEAYQKSLAKPELKSMLERAGFQVESGGG